MAAPALAAQPVAAAAVAARPARALEATRGSGTWPAPTGFACSTGKRSTSASELGRAVGGPRSATPGTRPIGRRDAPHLLRPGSLTRARPAPSGGSRPGTARRPGVPRRRRPALRAAAAPARNAVSAGAGGLTAAAERAGHRAAHRAAGHQLVGAAGHGRPRPGTARSVRRQHRRLVAGGADRRPGHLPVDGARDDSARAGAGRGGARVAAPVPDLLSARAGATGAAQETREINETTADMVGQEVGAADRPLARSWPSDAARAHRPPTGAAGIRLPGVYARHARSRPNSCWPRARSTTPRRTCARGATSCSSTATRFAS